MKINLFRLLITLVFVLPFEEQLLKHLSLSGVLYVYAKQGIDSLIILLSVCIIIWKGRPPIIDNRNGIRILIFLICFIITFLFSEVNFGNSVSFLVVFLRYILLASALACSLKNYDDILYMDKAFKIVFIVQLSFCCLQKLEMPWLIDLMLPYQIPGVDAKRIATSYSSWNKDVFGTFTNTISFAFYVMFYCVYAINRYNMSKVKTTLFFLICFFMIFWSKSEIALLVLLGYGIFKWLGAKMALIIAILTLFVITVGGYQFLTLNGIELSDYYQLAKGNRLGIILFTLPEFLSSGIKNMLFGIGLNKEVVYDVITSFHNVPSIFLYDKNSVPLEDVYVIALIVYFGVIGTIAYLMIFLGLWYDSWKGKFSSYQFNNIVKELSIIIIVLLFVNQAMSLKILGAAFWSVVGISAGIRINKVQANRL